MDSSTPNSASKRLLRWLQMTVRLPPGTRRAFPEFPEKVRQPAIFSLLFWSAFAMPVASWAVARYFSVETPISSVLAAVAVAGVLIALWRILPWGPRVGLRSKLAAPAFLTGVFVMGRILPGSTVLFYPFVFANGVFLFGFRKGIAYAAATLAVIFGDSALTMWLILSSPTSWFAITFNALLIVAVYTAVAIFIVGTCMSLVEVTRRRQETEVLLEELEGAHTDLKEYASRVRELTVSEERSRMAREMHDSVGHYLTVVNVQLEAANKFLDEGSPEDANINRARDELKKAKGLASEALLEVRRSVRALKPLAMNEGHSASDALRGLVHNFDGNGPSISLSVSGEERDLPAEAEVTLYRTLQESLTNVLKHSKARAVRASLAFDPGSVRLTVTDDGEGASPNSNGTGFGLKALGERASALGGTLESGNGPEGGFVVEVSLPIRDA